MENGIEYTFPETFYPSYAFFREHLSNFFPRFKEIIETGSIANSILKGATRLENLKHHYAGFKENITVSIFKEAGVQERSIKDLVVDFVEEDGYMNASTTWTDFIRAIEELPQYTCSIAVMVVRSNEHLKRVHTRVDPLPQSLKDNIVVYMTTKGRAYQFGHYTKHIHTSSEAEATHLGILSERIQCILEQKVVCFFDDISDFLSNFIPRGGNNVGSEKNAMSEVRTALNSSLRDWNVISDLSPCTATHLEGKDAAHDPTAMGKKDKRKKNDDFHTKLNDCVRKKTKTVLCGYYAARHGIKHALVNEFLNDGYFGLEKKVTEVLSTLRADDWPFKDGTKKAVSVCMKYAHACLEALEDVVRKVDAYMEDKVYFLAKLGRLQYELHGILQMADVPYEAHIPDIPKLPVQLQIELLDIPEITGCGQLCGHLTFHLSEKSLTKDALSQVEYLLRKYKYSFGYSTEHVDHKTQAGPDQISNGHAIREGGKQACGTLGCFVNINGEGYSNDHTYGISCAHCAETIGGLIEVGNSHGNGSFKHLGHVADRVYEPLFRDIAAVKVLRDMLTCCDPKMKRVCGMRTSTWNLLNELPKERTPVYKVGAISGISTGFIVSRNYMTKKAAEMTKRQVDVAKPDDNLTIDASKLHPEYSILIAPAESKVPGSQFSVCGDSGSTICMVDKRNAYNVHVVALLCGSVDKKFGDDTKRYICTHASFMKPLFEILETKMKGTFTPACSVTNADSTVPTGASTESTRSNAQGGVSGTSSNTLRVLTERPVPKELVQNGMTRRRRRKPSPRKDVTNEDNPTVKRLKLNGGN